MITTPLTQQLQIDLPIIGGAMYPCSNPELVAAISASGGIGVVQPISLTYVHGHEFRAGLRLIKTLTDKPIGMNALIEQSSKKYQIKMQRWVDIALEEGIRFFVTSLGKPNWVVERAHAAGAVVYHDVTQRKWAEKALDANVDGLIAVNKRAGGHAGEQSAAQLFGELADLGVPIICAGGIGNARDFHAALALGYAGVQMGTRFIATCECNASSAYKEAILQAEEHDIVLSEKITGVPVAIINTPYIQRMGLRANPLARRLLRGHKSKHLMRLFYTLKSLYQLKRSSLAAHSSHEFWQAGKSAAHINEIESVEAILQQFAAEEPT